MDVKMDQRWVCIFKITPSAYDESLLLENHKLNDKHIKVLQQLLLHQFSSFQGLKSTLVPVKDSIGFWMNHYIQIFHMHSCHWITASTIGCQPDTMMFYTQMLMMLPNKINKALDSSVKFQLPQVQVQKGCKDCGLFAIGFVVALAYV